MENETSTTDLPLIGITMGDPTGIGPETIAGAVLSKRVRTAIRPVVFGHHSIMEQAASIAQANVQFVKVNSIEECFDPSRFGEKQVPVLNSANDSVQDAPLRQVDKRGGQAAHDCLIAATELAIANKIDGIVTAPLNKEALHAAKIYYPGHTELLAKTCNVDQFSMLLYLGKDDEDLIARAGKEQSCVRGQQGLGVAHVTLHMPMREIFQQLTIGNIADTAELLNTFFEKLLHGKKFNSPALLRTGPESTPPSRPKLALAALNPHAGEAGLFGYEEQRTIGPAAHECQRRGLNVTGPIPTDTLMKRAAEGEFDGVVAMYHDQGHIALKLLGMHRAVNVTLGLPIVRTSVAHGTAYDIAWQGDANPNSMVEAICVAAKLAEARITEKIQGRI